MFPTTTIRTLVLGLALAAVLPAAGQTTRPATIGVATLTADVWTCPTHEQFRMTIKGDCPLCAADLVRAKIMLAGDESAIQPYPLDFCIVSGQPLGSMGTPIVMTHEGREVRFCCKGCIKRFEDNAAEYLGAIDDKIIEQQLPYYPLTTCPVSTEPLDAMGTPVNHVYDNRLVRLCCTGCLKSFTKDPAAYLGMLDAAVIAQQIDDYPLSTCPISKQKLGSMGEPVNYVVANRLVRFCCAGCAGGFNKAPTVHLATLDEARGDRPTTRKSARDGDRGHDHGHDHDH